jgi:signal transduction histidine kinase/ligand-binding sensor protein
MMNSQKFQLREAIKRLHSHDHLCLIYETREEQFEAAIPFIRRGLENGEKCIYIADDNTASEVMDAMRANGIDIDSNVNAGSLSVITKKDAYLREGYFDPDRMINFLKENVEAAKAEGYKVLRATGEMTWALGAEIGVERLMEYEAKLNYFFPENDIVAICQYNRNRFSPEVILDVIRTHPLVICGSTVCKNIYYVPPHEFLSSEYVSHEVERLLKDIVKRAEVEDALRISEERYRMGQEIGHVGNWEYNIQTGEFWGSDEAKRIYGFDPEQDRFSTEEVENCIQERERVHQALVDLIESGKPYNLEFEIHPRNSTVSKVIASVAKLQRDEHGKPFKVVGVMQDITERKRTEEALRESEKQVRRKLDAVLSPEADIGALELSDIIDSEKVQKLMDEFYQLTHIGIGIIDLHGKVLVGTGWQDICTKFHRVNPESRRLCIESDLELSRDVPVGTFNLYRCKNNMWDIATPIMLGDRQVGNIFLGQFLFDDETPDYKAFRQQARRYGFNEQEYIAALDRVPRWSRKMVNAAMSFYAAFAGMIGNLSYSNIKLANVLEERKRAEETLRAAEVELYENYFIQSTINMILNESLKNIPLEEFLQKSLNMILAVPWIAFESIGSIFLVEDEAEVLVMKAQSNMPEPLKRLCMRVPFGKCLCGRAAQSQEIQYAKHFDERHAICYEGIQSHGHCIVPILVGGRVLGIMNLYLKEGHIRNRKEEEFLCSVADTLAGAIVRKKTEEKISKLNAELEQRVTERTAQLEAANKELEAFSYSVSHDLRAPLRAISGFSDILLRQHGTKLDDEGKRICAIIIGNTQKMGQLIDEILALSRLSRAEMHFFSIDMKAMANEIYNELADPEMRKRIDFQLGDLPKANGDTVLLKQVWINLISNAIKFTSYRKRAVISFTSREEEDQVVYCVKDNGVGFNMKYKDKLFGVFQRLHSEKEFPGTGVGLAIVQRIVRRHGGEIWAEGEVNQGAEFCFSLPKRKG